MYGSDGIVAVRNKLNHALSVLPRLAVNVFFVYEEIYAVVFILSVRVKGKVVVKHLKKKIYSLVVVKHGHIRD